MADEKQDRKTDRQELLMAAERAVMGAREESYGSPEKSFNSIANFWNVYLFGKNGQPLTGGDVALMLDLMKTSRLLTGGLDQEDTWMDKAGYAACGYEVSPTLEYPA